ncbi:hypothetical protein MtrunA17_Chr1g0196301 [Medicago truncatula]|uniref:Uncharacterized protein n=1 Tax=Medicago truncatula TaxID=3880 RepID=G7I2R2_MEDTR|nr:hypothetical protein MTR_1g089050 [Medicago truncatula]RHN81184.1 hypothetical protein MtrunA17_Chr1g0196301 [Medicago truncatula]
MSSRVFINGQNSCHGQWHLRDMVIGWRVFEELKKGGCVWQRKKSLRGNPLSTRAWRRPHAEQLICLLLAGFKRISYRYNSICPYAVSLLPIISD